MRFHITPHFYRRTGDRVVSVEEAKAVVKYPDKKDKQYTGEHKGLVIRFAKEASGRTLIVVAEIKNDECWLITTFYESV
jgi:hypothetical protein